MQGSWRVGWICGALLACSAPSPGRASQARSGATPEFTAAADYPIARAFEASNGMQGVTHDSSHWYFTSSAGKWDGLHGRIWKVPLATDLNQPPVILGNPFAGVYNHFGDLVHVRGSLYVALEPNAGRGRDGAFGVFDTALQPTGWAKIPDNSPQLTGGSGGFAPWIAYNPKDGLFYSSRFDSGQLHRYAIQLAGTEPHVRVTYQSSVPLRDGNGHPISLPRLQGGKFSASGLLYLTCDAKDRGGIYVVDPSDGRIQAWIAVPIDRGWTDQEVEGMDIVDLSAAHAPGIAGQIHVIVIQNNLLRADAWSFKHFQVAKPDAL